jgi:hypothetical protein
VSVNPIDRPDFNPATYREPNPDTIAKLRSLGNALTEAQRAVAQIRDEMREALQEARDTGHSFPQMKEASGVSIASIQRMLGLG